MKIRLVVALVGLAMSIALPTFAQQQSTVDPEVRQGIEAVLTRFGEAFNKRDAAAMAALYTQEAVQLWTWMPIEEAVASGRRAIEKRYEVMLSSSPGTFTGQIVEVYVMATTWPWSPKLLRGRYEGLQSMDLCSRR
jgi:hypothetical protein